MGLFDLKGKTLPNYFGCFVSSVVIGAIFGTISQQFEWHKTCSVMALSGRYVIRTQRWMRIFKLSTGDILKDATTPLDLFAIGIT